MPSSSSGCACAGRPPAISATGGRIRRTTSSCSSRSSAGTKPRMPTPHVRPANRCAVSVSSASTSVPRISASARNGTPPASATAWANGARSDTRVIGPWKIG